MKKESISVSIIDDDADVCEKLSKLINAATGLSCLSTHANCETALQHLGRDKPDVVLMDIGLPGMSGVEGTTIVKDRWPEIEVVMLTAHTEDDLVFESLRSGASGYLLKGAPSSELLDALREVCDGGAPMNMRIARKVAESFRVKSTPDPLTRREQQVLNRLREGQSYQAIANELFVARSTVKFHIKNIYRKLHIANKYEAMKL
ncbi:MAG: response regulator transcription factor [Ignavibacteriae bacterium]|nr:response regulator transcription factor [Ignavibacteriota bacterium]